MSEFIINEVNIIMNMNNKKTRKLISSVIIIFLILSMLVGIVAGALLSF